MCSVAGYCIFMYSAFGQACWPWMTPCTVGSVAHVQYTASWKNIFEVLESSGRVLEFFLNKRLWTLDAGCVFDRQSSLEKRQQCQTVMTEDSDLELLQDHEQSIRKLEVRNQRSCAICKMLWFIMIL